MRDVITVGHVAKFLSRFSFIGRAVPERLRYEILGLSNPVFDAASLGAYAKAASAVPSAPLAWWDPASVAAASNSLTHENTMGRSG